MVVLEVVSSLLITFSQLMDIPDEYKFPLAIAAAILGFLVVLGAVSFHSSSSDGKKKKAQPHSAMSTPTKSKEALGTVTTPAGRRSARLAKTRKED